MDISYDANLDLESVALVGKAMIMITWKLFHIHNRFSMMFCRLAQ